MDFSPPLLDMLLTSSPVVVADTEANAVVLPVETMTDTDMTKLIADCQAVLKSVQLLEAVCEHLQTLRSQLA